MPQPLTTIEYANISQYLAATDKRRQKLFSGSSLSQDLSQLLYFVRTGFEWKVGVDPTDADIPLINNYLYALCGKYIPQAQVAIGNIGGQVIQPPIGQTSTVITVYVQFTVGDVGSLMNAGDTQLTLVYDDVLLNSISVMKDTIPLPTNLNNQQSFTALYTSSSVTITFNEPVQDGQLFQIRGLRYVN